MKITLSILFICLISIRSFSQIHTVSSDTLLMGSAFSFTSVSDSFQLAFKANDEAIKEVTRIESLISSWNKDSETALINNNAGINPVKVSTELFELIERCIKVSELSNGYFDISFASIDNIWKFDGKTKIELPSDEQISNSIKNINYKNIILNKEEQSVFLNEKGMKIGFGAIGKGYAAFKAKEKMQSIGINSGVVNAGGDLLSWGTKTVDMPWTIGVADPKNKEKIIFWLNISDMAVVTSGNYEKYVEINGERYCHIINPKTGWPVKGLSSVTIICENAELSDALATTVFVLGKDDGLKLIDHLDGIECIIIDDNSELYFSKNLKKNYIIDNEITN